MRLLELFQQEAYQPLARGEAFPQYYENGDRFTWDNEGMWHWRFWTFMKSESRYFFPTHDEAGAFLAGGEL